MGSMRTLLGQGLMQRLARSQYIYKGEDAST